jgi:hypothetical protein
MMQTFSSWTLETVRKGGFSMGWLEEKVYEWVPLIAASIKGMINAETFLVITDNEREWFEAYLLKKLNKKEFDRPLLPIISLTSVYPHIDTLTSLDKIALLEDMLNLSFPNGWRFFYIGEGRHPRSKIAKNKDSSLMWLFDERIQNSFYLNSKDEELDIKLLQLANLLDKSIDALLFNEVDIEGAV